MIYGGAGFLAVYDSAPRPPPPPSPVSNLPIFLRLPVWSSLLPGEGGAGWARSRIIRPQESLALYKSFNTLLISPHRKNRARPETLHIQGERYLSSSRRRGGDNVLVIIYLRKYDSLFFTYI
jgi:hypothetical protein